MKIALYSLVLFLFVPTAHAQDSVPGDINGDRNVDFADFLILSAHFGKKATAEQGDFDNDHIVTFSDFLVLSANFGRRDLRDEGFFSSLRVFGDSLFCNLEREAEVICSQFQVLKDCLEGHNLSLCGIGTHREVQCGVSEQTLTDNRFCETFTYLSEGHPLRTDEKQRHDQALCIDSNNASYELELNNGSLMLGEFPIGFFSCDPARREVADDTVSCWDFKADGELEACYEVGGYRSELSRELLESKCTHLSYNRETRDGPCPEPRANFVHGCRKFLEEEGAQSSKHHGEFYYRGFYHYDEGHFSADWNESFLTEKRKCLSDDRSSYLKFGIWESLFGGIDKPVDIFAEGDFITP